MFNIFLRHWVLARPILSTFNVNVAHWLCYTYPQIFPWAPPAGFHWAPVHQQTKTASSEPPTVASMWAWAVFQRMTGSVRSNIMRKKKKWKKRKKKKERSVKLLLQINVVYLQENACKEHQNMLHTNAHVSENDMLAYNPESRVSPFVTRTITKQRFQGGNYQVTDLRLTLNSSKVH